MIDFTSDSRITRLGSLCSSRGTVIRRSGDQLQYLKSMSLTVHQKSMMLSDSLTDLESQFYKGGLSRWFHLDEPVAMLQCMSKIAKS